MKHFYSIQMRINLQIFTLQCFHHDERFSFFFNKLQLILSLYQGISSSIGSIFETFSENWRCASSHSDWNFWDACDLPEIAWVSILGSKSNTRSHQRIPESHCKNKPLLMKAKRGNTKLYDFLGQSDFHNTRRFSIIHKLPHILCDRTFINKSEARSEESIPISSSFSMEIGNGILSSMIVVPFALRSMC